MEGFGGVPSYNTPWNDFVSVTSFSLHHHKSPWHESDTTNKTEILSFKVIVSSATITLIFVHFGAFIEAFQIPGSRKDPICAANMGSKISLLVYEWPLIKCKIWYMNGLIFQKFPKFEPKLGSNLRKFCKNRVILLKIWLKIGPIGMWMGHFFLKNLYLYLYLVFVLSNFVAAHPYQNQTWVPPEFQIIFLLELKMSRQTQWSEESPNKV